jgi:nucleoside-diphosphate-sugar epimerase
MNLEGKTILITGSSGLIGSRTAERAIERGMRVRGLDLTPASVPGVEMVLGSVTDPAAAEQACQGVDIVLHTAAIVREEGDMAQFMNINVGGAVNMAKTAQEAGAQCFVNLSSVMVYGYRYPNHVTEAGPFYQGDNPYCKTKLEAERQVLALNQPPQFGVINIRPGDVYGPGSVAWVVRPLRTLKRRQFVLLDGGNNVMNHVYVDNLIDAIFLAIERDAYGETFNVTDGYETTWRTFINCLAEISGLPKPFLVLPSGLVKLIIQLRLIDDSVTTASINTLTRPYAYSIEKARQMLGYQPQVSLEEGMRRTAAWLKTTDIYAPEWSERSKASITPGKR